MQSNSCFLQNLEKILDLKPHGIFLSNGPGDPAATGKYAIPILNKLIKQNFYIWNFFGSSNFGFSFCWKTKMKLGHRGANRHCQNLIYDKVEITSQNHGFVVVGEFTKKIKVTHKSLFDNTIEGIRPRTTYIFSTISSRVKPWASR